MIYTDNIIDSIDIINATTISSEMNVIEALTESIDKSFVIMENYENDDLSSFSIFQEGKILDTVKKEWAEIGFLKINSQGRYIHNTTINKEKGAYIILNLT